MLHSILISLVVGPMLAVGDVNASSGDRRLPRHVQSFSGGLLYISPMAASASQLLRAGEFSSVVDFDNSEGVDIRRAGPDYGAAYATSVGVDGAYRWTYVADGPGNDRARGVAIDSHENVTVVGEFYGTVDFDPGPGEDIHVAGEARDNHAFVTRLSSLGAYQWTQSFSGPGGGIAKAVDADQKGMVIFAGNFGGLVDLDPGPSEHNVIARLYDVFVEKLDQSGNLEWVNIFGGPSSDDATDLAVGPDDEVVVTGHFRYSADFDPGPGVDVRFTVSAFPNKDVFITKFGADGSYLWTRTMQTESENPRVEVGLDGAVICAGRIDHDADMDPTEGVDWRTVHPSPGPIVADGYVTKLASDGSYEWTFMIGGAGYDYVFDAAVGAEGDVIAVGTFDGVMILGEGPNMQELKCGAPVCSYRVGLSRDGRLQWAMATDWGGGGGVATHGDRIYMTESNAARGRSFVADLSPNCEFARWDSDETDAKTFITVLQYGPPRGGDVDFDGDVDLRDVAQFYRCYTGDPRDKHNDPLQVDCGAGCDEFDLSPDAVLDRDDYSLLLKRFEGPK